LSGTADLHRKFAIAANASVFVFPIYSEKYPYGIRNSGITPDHLRAAFKKDFMLLLREKDVNEDDQLAQTAARLLFHKGND